MDTIKKLLKSRRVVVALAGAAFAIMSELGVPGISEATVLEIITIAAVLIGGISIDKEKKASE